MPSLAEHQSNSFTKLLLLGDAKSGKTTSLASLVKAGYKLRIIDLDNLLDGLKDRVMSECPHLADNVEFRTMRDNYKTGPAGPMLDGPAKAFIDAMKMLDHWKYDDTDLGKPKDWGPDCIVVVDGLTRLCEAAYAYHLSMQPAKMDGRAAYYDAQRAVDMVLANLTSEKFRTNVIMICHGIYRELPDGSTKIFPTGVGKAQSPNIPSYFPVYIRYTNKAGKREIQVKTDAMIDLAMPKLHAFEGKSLPIEDGLATIFDTLRGKVAIAPPATVVKPTAIARRR